jgi:zinc/manganese transport system permease protein
VNAHTVIKTAVLYALVGLFHFVFRRQFLSISVGAHVGESTPVGNVKFWDFLFYTSFGFVVTSSVAIAGVLLVFSYLIVPSVAAMLFAHSIGRRLAIGWTMGALVTAIGVWLSFKLDLPTGATIVCSFGLALVLLALVRVFVRPRLA